MLLASWLRDFRRRSFRRSRPARRSSRNDVSLYLTRLEDRQVLSAGGLAVVDLGDLLSTAADTNLGSSAGSFSQAESIGNNAAGAQDVDLYSLQATAGSTLIASTRGQVGTGTTLRLFDSLGNELASQPGADLDGRSRLEFTFATNGTFHVGVSGAGNDAYSPVSGRGTLDGVTGDYQFNALLVLDTGLDGQPGTALINGLIGDAGGGSEIDLYRLEADAGTTLTARTSLPLGATDQTNTFLRLFDASGNQLAFDDDDGAGLSSKIEFEFTSDGTYFVGVSAFPNLFYSPVDGTGTFAGDVGEYRLSLNFDAGDTLGTAAETGLAGASATSFSILETLGEGPSGDADVDLYRFEANAGDDLTVATSAAAGSDNVDTILRLFDADGNELAFNDDRAFGDFFSQIDFTFGVAGTYFIGVSAFPNDLYDPLDGSGAVSGDLGDYRVNIALAGAPATISGTVFRDEDGDGQQGGLEPGQSGVLVFVDENQNGGFDGAATVSSTDVPLAIPDAFFGFVTPVASELTVSGFSGVIQDVNVTLDITHTFNDDLDLFLISPDGTRIALALSSDFDLFGENLTGTTFDDQATTHIFFANPPYTGSFQPNEALALLNGENPNGVWQLEIADNFDFDTGTLNSWSITVTTGDAEPHTFTDADGNYTLTDLQAGTHAIAQIPPPNHEQSFPSGNAPHTVTVAPGEDLAGVDFGNQPVNGEIRGTVFEDVDENGARDSGEPGTPGVTVFLDTNDNDQFDQSEFASSDVPAGIFDFQTTTSSLSVAGLGGPLTDLNVTLDIEHTFVGDLDVFLVSPSGTQVQLVSGFALEDFAGQDFAGTTLDDQAATSINDAFAFAPYTGAFRPFGSLAVLNGEDPNGVWELRIADVFAGDQGTLHNWSLTIATEPFALTDANGDYAFTDLAAGTYLVGELPPLNLVQTFPGGDGFQTVVLSSGQVANGVDFGNRVGFAEIQGVVFEDINSDGFQDAGEFGQFGATVFIDLNGDFLLDGFEPFAQTDGLGNYTLTDVVPGDYNLVQIAPAGFLQVSPSGFAPQPVSLAVDEVLTGVNFGNRQAATISGVKFDDVDGDGFQGTGEFGLGGFQILAFDEFGNFAAEAFTDSFDGSYTLTVLPGTYSIFEVPQPGFMQTLPATGNYFLTVAAGEFVPGIDFGNFDLDVIGDDFGSAAPVQLVANGTTPVLGTIDQFDDVDVYQVVAPQTGFLGVSMTAPNTGDFFLDPFVQVFDSAGNFITFDDDSAGFPDSLAAFRTVQGETFFIFVSDAFFFGAGDYELDITSTPAAQPLTFVPGAGGTFTGAITGNIGTPGQVQVFEVTVPALSAVSDLRLTVNGTGGSGLDPQLLVLDAATLTLVGPDGVFGVVDNGFDGLVNGGERFLAVVAGFDDTVGGFRLDAVLVPLADDFGNDAQSAFDLGQVIPGQTLVRDGSIETPFDVDAFLVQAPAGQTGILTIDLISDDPFFGLDPVLEVFDANGTLIAFNDDVDLFANNFNSQVQLAAVGGAPFLVLARGFFSSEGDYTLTANFQAIADDFGNSRADAEPLGTFAVESPGPLQQGGVIDLPGDLDFFQVQIVGDGALQITQNAVGGGSLDPFLRVFDAAGNLLAANDDVGFAPRAAGGFTFSLNSLVSIDVSDGDVLFVQAGAFSTSTGAYNLVFSAGDDFPNDLPNASFLALPAAGTTRAGEIETAGDTDVFQFTASDDGRFTIQVDGQPEDPGAVFNPLLTVFQEFDTGKFREVARNASLGGSASRIDLFVQRGDEFVIRVAEAGTGTGTYTLAIAPSLIVNDLGDTLADAELVLDPTLPNLGLDPGLFELTAGDVDFVRFVARNTGVARFNAGAGGLDPRLAVFEFVADPRALDNLIPQQIASGGQSVSFAVTAGQQYAVRISSATGAAGAYAPSLSLSAPLASGGLTAINEAGAFVFTDVRQVLLNQQGGDQTAIADALIRTAVNTFTSSSAFDPTLSYLILVLDPVDAVLSETTTGSQVGFQAGQGQINEVGGSFFSGDGVVEVLILPTANSSFNLSLAGLGAEFLFDARLVTPGGPAGGLVATVTDASAGGRFNPGQFAEPLLGNLNLVLDFTATTPGGGGGPGDVGLAFALSEQAGQVAAGFGLGLGPSALAFSSEAAQAIEQLRESALALESRPGPEDALHGAWGRMLDTLWETWQSTHTYVDEVLATLDDWLDETAGVRTTTEAVWEALPDDAETLLKKRQWLWSNLGEQSSAAPLKLFFQLRNALQRFVPSLEAPVEGLDAPIEDLEAPIEDLEAPVEDLEAPIKDLETPVEGLEAPVEGLEAPVDEQPAGDDETADTQTGRPAAPRNVDRDVLAVFGVEMPEDEDDDAETALTEPEAVTIGPVV